MGSRPQDSVYEHGPGKVDKRICRIRGNGSEFVCNFPARQLTPLIDLFLRKDARA